MASLMRIGTLEAGHGCLPFWIARLDEHAETIKAPIAVKRSRRPAAVIRSDVARPGRGVSKRRPTINKRRPTIDGNGSRT